MTEQMKPEDFQALIDEALEYADKYCEPGSTGECGEVSTRKHLHILARAHRAMIRAIRADVRIGMWLSAALDDSSVCAKFKADILEWMESATPPT